MKKLSSGIDSEFLKIAVTLPNSIENNRSDLDQKLLENIKELFNKAIEKVIDFRVQEGKSMELDLVGNLDIIQKKLFDIEKLAP